MISLECLLCNMDESVSHIFFQCKIFKLDYATGIGGQIRETHLVLTHMGLALVDFSGPSMGNLEGMRRVTMPTHVVLKQGLRMLEIGFREGAKRHTRSKMLYKVGYLGYGIG